MPALEFDVSPSAHLHTFRVEAADIDEFGHANNVVWVRWINDAALSHAYSVGFGPDVGRARGFIWVVRRHDVEYFWPAFEGQTIECATWPAQVRGATSLRRSVFRSGGRVLVRAETTWALLNPNTGRPRRVPPEMMAAYRYEAQ